MATLADEDVLRELWKEFEAEVPSPLGLEETWDEEWEDTRRDVEAGTVFLAEDGEGAAGVARASLHGRARAHVHLVHVRPRARRQGVTKQLLRGLAERLREDGVAQITLNVLVSDEPARAVWQRLGFREVGLLLTTRLDDLEGRLQAEEPPSSGTVFVQTDDAAKVEAAARRYVRRLGRSRWTEVKASASGWVSVRDELCDREPAFLQRLAKELSHLTGAVVCALGVERGAAVRYVLYERGSVVDEYLSLPELYGPLPPGDVVALGANPRVVARLTGADPVRVRAVARTAASPSELPPPDELRAAIADVLGLT